MEIWEKDYPLTICGTSMKKMSFLESFKDFKKYTQENKPLKKDNREKIDNYSYYLHLKNLRILIWVILKKVFL